MCHHIEYKFLQNKNNGGDSMSVTFKVIKKNQILVVAVLLMLVVAGYLNYQYDPNSVYDVELTGVIEDNLGDAVFVNSNSVESNIEEVASSIQDADSEGYFIQTKIDRANSYAEQIEIYEKMLENPNIPQDQKETAQEQIRHINAERDAITISENLIKLNGFQKVVILVNGNSINVIIEEEELSSKQIAQIQNIVQHEFDAEVSNIHITVK